MVSQVAVVKVKDAITAGVGEGYSDQRPLSDLESGTPSQTQVATTDSNPDASEIEVVWWEGNDDPANPMNWSPVKKWSHIIILAINTFLTPLASSMFAPAAAQAMVEFDAPAGSLLGALVVSVYVLGLAIGPLLLAPLSEVYGRWILYTMCNILYTVFTLACALSTSLPMLIIFRFLAGCAGSNPLAVGGGTIGDLFPVDQRGVGVALYTLGPVVGPAIGPVAGGFLSEAKGWRWIFWLLMITGGAMTVVQILIMRETYAITILKWKVRRLQKETGNKWLRSKLDSGIPAWKIVTRAIIRPTKLIVLSPISVLVSLGSAFVYGLFYLVVTTLPSVFSDVYGFSPGITGLAYIGVGLGCTCGLLVFSATSDRYVRSRMAKGKLKPEDRLILVMASGPLLVIGFFWYGWSAQAHTHWIVPILGSTIFGAGVTTCLLPSMAYLVDAFIPYSASALAANTVLRSIGGALLPLAGSSMYQALSFGWGNSLLAFLSLAMIPISVLMYKYGETIRVRYPVNLE